MAISISDPDEPATAPEPILRTLVSVAEQRAAIDMLVALARRSIRVFDVDLAQMGWNGAARAETLATFLRRPGDPRLEVIVHDTRYLESSCPRLTALLRTASASMTIYRTGPQARTAQDPMTIVDGRHFLHRFHADQPRASFGVEQAALARPLVQRFEEIWATGEPGLGASVLGL